MAGCSKWSCQTSRRDRTDHGGQDEQYPGRNDLRVEAVEVSVCCANSGSGQIKQPFALTIAGRFEQQATGIRTTAISGALSRSGAQGRALVAERACLAARTRARRTSACCCFQKSRLAQVAACNKSPWSGGLPVITQVDELTLRSTLLAFSSSPLPCPSVFTNHRLSQSVRGPPLTIRKPCKCVRPPSGFT